MFSFIKDKKMWTRPPDVMCDNELPMRQNSLLFGGIALGRAEYVGIRKTLPADSKTDEVIRNFFIRQPVLWVKSRKIQDPGRRSKINPILVLRLETWDLGL